MPISGAFAARFGCRRVLAVAALVVAALSRTLSTVPAKGLGTAAGYSDNVRQIATLLFSKYVFAFEVTSALLITAAVGAMVLAHVERPPGTKVTQRDLSRRRFRSGTYPGPLPGPGVFATSNAVGTPALLPDGRTAGSSVDDVVEPLSLKQVHRSEP